MSLMQSILFHVPSVILCLLMVGGSVAMTILGLLVTRRFVSHHRLKAHNDVSGPIFSTLGVVYAVLLAFVVVVVWERFDKTDMNAQKEANCLVDLWRDSESFAPEFKGKMQGLFRDYSRIVVDEEWGMLAKGQMSPKANAIVKEIWGLYSSYLPRNATEQAFFEESVRKLNEFGEFRVMRIVDSRSGIHSILWLVLILGGIVTITFTFFFGAESLRTQAAMAVLLAVIISLIIFTIISLDYPFTGSVMISPSEVFEVLAGKIKVP